MQCLNKQNNNNNIIIVLYLYGMPYMTQFLAKVMTIDNFVFFIYIFLVVSMR